MSWRRHIGMVDEDRRLALSVLGQQLNAPAHLGRAAATWARLLERKVRIVPSAHLPVRSRLPSASVGLELEGGTGRLEIDTHLLGGLTWVLGGLHTEPVGPVPLSPAEEGLCAYMALAWCGLLRPQPRVAWVHGGDPDWPLEPLASGRVAWRVEIQKDNGAGDIVGGVVWRLPRGPVVPVRHASDWVPLPLRVEQGPVVLGLVSLYPGALIYLQRGFALLTSSGTRLRDLRWTVQGLAVASKGAGMAREPNPEDIEGVPITLQVHLADLVMSVGDVAALAPGQVLDLGLDDPPVVTLRSAGRPVATGVLVDDDGRLAVQLSQVRQV